MQHEKSPVSYDNMIHLKLISLYKYWLIFLINHHYIIELNRIKSNNFVIGGREADAGFYCKTETAGKCGKPDSEKLLQLWRKSQP